MTQAKPMRRHDIASKLVDVVNLLNEQRQAASELRAGAKRVVAIGKRISEMVERLDEQAHTPTLIDEALADHDAQPIGEDELAELMFSRSSLKPFDVGATVLAVLKIAEKS